VRRGVKPRPCTASRAAVSRRVAWSPGWARSSLRVTAVSRIRAKPRALVATVWATRPSSRRSSRVPPPLVSTARALPSSGWRSRARVNPGCAGSRPPATATISTGRPSFTAPAFRAASTRAWRAASPLPSRLPRPQTASWRMAALRGPASWGQASASKGWVSRWESSTRGAAPAGAPPSTRANRVARPAPTGMTSASTCARSRKSRRTWAAGSSRPAGCRVSSWRRRANSSTPCASPTVHAAGGRREAELGASGALAQALTARPHSRVERATRIAGKLRSQTGRTPRAGVRRDLARDGSRPPSQAAPRPRKRKGRAS
jgi:hypothetical protein